jgi:hypothetical protein
MNAIAELARAASVHFEAKKTGFGQAQDGWSLTLRIQDVDVPPNVRDAKKGTRFMVALVEIGDDEQPLPPHPAEAAPRPALTAPQPQPVGENKQKRSFEDMAPSQQAGMLSQDLSFQRFLAEEYHDQWIGVGWEDGERIAPAIRAGVLVRTLCKVNSRAEIRSDNAEWSALVLAYRLWQRHPELSEA